MPQRYVRFLLDDGIGSGLVYDDQVRLLQGDIFGQHRLTDRVFPLDSMHLLTPCQPSKIVCVGLNYHQHAAEVGMQLPAEPALFLKPPTALLPHHGDIVYWPMVGQLDYEGELAIVVGRKCHQVDVEAALEYVFGYTIANDVTARDLQNRDGQWTRAKSFDTFSPLGPAIVTGIDAADLFLRTLVNGELRQNGRTSDLIFPIPYLVSFISRVMALLPGDVILTGTPFGIGPLQVGDEVEVQIERLGALRNRVVQP